MHQKECDINKKRNLQSNECSNFEKSSKFTNASTLQMQVNNPSAFWNKKTKDYNNFQSRKGKSISMNILADRKL